MKELDRLDAAAVRAAVEGYRDALGAHREAINRLNVYPVPDGDTGTNMALTLRSVCEELASAGAEADMASTCKAIGYGALMGARGNSGVILSGILRGLSEVLRDAEAVDATTLATALEQASAGAYGAVGKPVEGTILTVVREASEAAAGAAAGGGSLVEVLCAARDRAADALARTPELLPVLKQAGVVDAGGAGFLLLLDVLLHVADGRPVPEPDVLAEGPDLDAVHEAHAEGGDIADLRYEVMYLLEAPDEAVRAFKDVWAGIGDSIVVVGGDGIWNCHIHTDDIGAAIEAGIEAGRPRRIRVTDLLEQVAAGGGELHEERWVREGAGAGGPGGLDIDEPCTTAVVAVAVGDGVRRLFHNLHVQRIVTGGQTMNPSTSDLLAAVEACPADNVVILPNNKNIVPVAQQVDEQTAKSVRVVPTRGVTEGFAALLAYDPEADLDANAAAMAAAAEGVVAGEVTQAVRDSASDAGPIAAGDWLGISRRGIEVVDADLAGACTGLLDTLVTDDHEIVTIIEGDGASAAVTRRIKAWLEEHRPGAEAEVHHGGQPLYPYLFGIE